MSNVFARAHEIFALIVHAALHEIGMAMTRIEVVDGDRSALTAKLLQKAA